MASGSANFSSLIQGTPTALGLVAAQATAYEVVNMAYQDAYDAAITPATRTKGAVAAKNDAKKALKTMAADLAAIIDATPIVTDQQKIDLGLAIRKQQSPRPAPSTSPTIDVLSALGRTLKLRLHDDNSARRGRPEGTDGVTVMAFIGSAPSNSSQDWKFMGNFNKTTVDITVARRSRGATVFWAADLVQQRAPAEVRIEAVSERHPAAPADRATPSLSRSWCPPCTSVTAKSNSIERQSRCPSQPQIA